MNKQETVIVTYHPTRESGRRKGWGKHVTGVDAQKKNGYAFEGAFLNTGENELPVGAAIIEKNPAGSVKNFYYVWRLGYVAGDGAIEWDKGEWNRSEFISFRNRVAERVAGETPDKAKKPSCLQSAAGWNRALRTLMLRSRPSGRAKKPMPAWPTTIDWENGPNRRHNAALPRPVLRCIGQFLRKGKWICRIPLSMPRSQAGGANPLMAGVLRPLPLRASSVRHSEAG